MMCVFDLSGHLIVHHFVNVISYFNIRFVFSSFVTGSSLKSENSTLQRVGISRRIRWLHDVAVNWSRTSHLSQEEDRLCSRSVNRILVKIWYFVCWESLYFLEDRVKCAAPKNRARKEWEKTAVPFHFSRDSSVMSSFHEFKLKGFKLRKESISSFAKYNCQKFVCKVYPWMIYVIYQTRATVFHRDIQTPRRELKIRRAAEYFWRNSRCLDSRWNAVSSAWYIFSIETKPKE